MIVEGTGTRRLRLVASKARCIFPSVENLLASSLRSPLPCGRGTLPAQPLRRPNLDRGRVQVWAPIFKEGGRGVEHYSFGVRKRDFGRLYHAEEASPESEPVILTYPTLPANQGGKQARLFRAGWTGDETDDFGEE